MDSEKILSILANKIHIMKSNLLENIISQCEVNDNNIIISKEVYNKWQQQIITPLDHLPEQERKINYILAKKILKEIEKI